MSNTPDKRTRDILKEYFETGDRPKEIEFVRLIDSGINQKDDELFAVNGKIGVGTNDPQSKLHVDGDIAVTNHIHGDKTNKGNDDDVLIVENGSQVQLFGSRHTGKSGGIVIGAKKDNSDPTSGKILFSQNSQTGWQDNVVIDHEGKVGIGAMSPQNKLEIKGTVDTGLRLPTGKGDGKVLTSDSSGNAIWKPATDITGALWQAIGTAGHIRNGNQGNVGVGNSNPQATLDISGKSENENNHGILKINAGTIGTDLRFGLIDGSGGYSWIQSHGAIPLKINPHPAGNTTTINEGGGKVGIGTGDPKERLHVWGNLQVQGDIIGKESGGMLNIFSAKMNGGAYMHLNSSLLMDSNNPSQPHANQGGITFVATAGSGNTNGFTFMQNNPGSSNPWPTCMSIEGNRNSYFWNNKIYFRGSWDQNHGLAHFGDTNEKFAGVDVNGPALFGFAGGALGSNQYGTENIALRWDQYQRVGINGLGDNAHWPFKLQVWGDNNVPLMLETKTNDIIHFYDNDFAQDPQKVRAKAPFTFVDRVGRGFRFWNADGAGETLRVNGDGSVKIKNQTPFVIERINLDPNSSNHILTGKYLSDYGAAVIVGYNTTNTLLFDNISLGRSQFELDAYTYSNGNQWYVRADVKSDDRNIALDEGKGNEKWTVTIMYIRKELVSWSNPYEH